MSNNKPFIVVTEKSLADSMIAAGFVLVSADKFKWAFLNDSNVKFDLKNASVCYSNTLTF